MEWTSYISLAGDLVGQGSEASKRSAVSRAYYGAFNHARLWLRTRGHRIDDHRAHEMVWRSFRDAERATLATERYWQTVGELGGVLRQLRNQADYVDEVPELDRRAIDAVSFATRIISLLDRLELS
jgi:uncharacterized protein (UPF0332 family)